MTRVVADTNVFISAIVFGGLPEAFLNAAFLNSFQLVTSYALLDELEDKLRLKFRYSDERAHSVRLTLARRSVVVHPEIVLAVVKEDPDDDRVLECAVSGNAVFVVTGDKHLLNIGSYAGIQIVTVRQFLSQLQI